MEEAVQKFDALGTERKIIVLAYLDVLLGDGPRRALWEVLPPCSGGAFKRAIKWVREAQADQRPRPPYHSDLEDIARSIQRARKRATKGDNKA